MTLRGADAATVRAALDTGDPLPGTGGFAGEVDGRLVRDVLGREPLFRAADGDDWGFDPAAVTDPQLLPAGHVVDGTERQVWSLPAMAPLDDRRTAVASVREALASALDPLAGTDVPVAFSGGVDSALVASVTEGPLYVAGFPGSHDVEAARSAAVAMGRADDLQVVELDHETLSETVARVARATGRTNAMDVGIAVPLAEVAARAAADGYDRLALGQGADELFGGYAKVARAPEDPRVEAATVRGAAREVVETLPAQLPRDVVTVRANGVEPVTPLLHDAVVEAALALPGTALVDDRGERKVALRLAARSWLPDRVAFRKKKAVQYGSLVARELDRLARQAGFKRRMDDHVSQYVASLVD